MTLSELKKLAGINEFKGYVKYDPVDPYSGSNISLTGDEKGQLQKKHNIKPGTKEWFQLWFSLPKLTGEKPIGQGIR
jgi:hypothetical protein